MLIVYNFVIYGSVVCQKCLYANKQPNNQATSQETETNNKFKKKNTKHEAAKCKFNWILCKHDLSE